MKLLHFHNLILSRSLYNLFLHIKLRISNVVKILKILWQKNSIKNYVVSIFSHQQQHKHTQKTLKIKDHGYVTLHNLGAFPIFVTSFYLESSTTSNLQTFLLHKLQTIVDNSKNKIIATITKHLGKICNRTHKPFTIET